MDPHDEHDIARGLREGRTDAWRALYDRFARPLWRVVARQMGTATADVADVVQETMLAAARSARQYDAARGSLWMWLCGIARQKVALHFRTVQRHARACQPSQHDSETGEPLGRLPDQGDGPPIEGLAQAELAGRVRAALTQLPVDYENLLTAKYFDDVSVEQLATAEQCTDVAIRSKLARARRAFRDVFLKKGLGIREEGIGD